MLSETTIINYLRTAIPKLPQGFMGIGDDAAVIPMGIDKNLVISKDLLVENIHFRLAYSDPQSLAHKALHVNLSDMAAMGVKGESVLLGLALPENLPSTWIEAFLDSFIQTCKENDLFFVGGDTTASKDGLFISVTIMAEAPLNHVKLRSGAKAEDIIAVVGSLGEAHAGLSLLEKNIGGFDLVKDKQLRPQAKVKEGLWLGKQASVTAMMDISDGLYLDLTRLCQASKGGGEIVLDKIIPSDLLQQVCDSLSADPLEFMLVGGEDYGLLLTIDPQEVVKIAREFSQEFGYSMQIIGRITSQPIMTLTKEGKSVPFPYKVFTHFGESMD